MPRTHRPADPASIRAPPRSGHAVSARPANTAPTPDATAPRPPRIRRRPGDSTRQSGPGARCSPHGSQTSVPGRRPRCERAVGSIRPAEDRCQPVGPAIPHHGHVRQHGRRSCTRPDPRISQCRHVPISPVAIAAAPSSTAASLPARFSLPLRRPVSDAVDLPPRPMHRYVMEERGWIVRHGFWPLALLWLPAGLVCAGAVRFGAERQTGRRTPRCGRRRS